ncbi:MAG TPA: hypothetical protein VKD90_02760 [Gemmataceae bacterium]|nr:hypothetical protein [Gemmataceae bacterium]
MTRLAIFLATAGLALAAPAPKEQGRTYLDLQPQATHKLADDSPSGMAGNNLAEVPAGEREFAGVKFKVGEKYLQLGSLHFQTEKPDKVEGIKVGRPFAKLHILQATGYGSSPEGSPKHVPDDTVIAEYKVRYDGGETATIEVVYGKDVRDYWFNESSKGVTRGRVAWEGDCEAAKRLRNRVRLYLTTWENPKPGKRVKEIDFVRGKDPAAAPLCVALTVE